MATPFRFKSLKAQSAIAHSCDDNLFVRAADVTLSKIELSEDGVSGRHNRRMVSFQLGRLRAASPPVVAATRRLLLRFPNLRWL
jgi:hypothetical protein